MRSDLEQQLVSALVRLAPGQVFWWLLTPDELSGLCPPGDGATTAYMGLVRLPRTPSQRYLLVAYDATADLRLFAVLDERVYVAASDVGALADLWAQVAAIAIAPEGAGAFCDEVGDGQN